VTSYSRQDVLRILQISARQLAGWEKADLVPVQQCYTFQDLGQLRTLRALRENDVSAATIRHSISAMKAVAGMENPLLEASLVQAGTRLAFRHSGTMVDPIRRQLLFDFERLERQPAIAAPAPLRRPGTPVGRGVQERFTAAVQAEESGEKNVAVALYSEIIAADADFAPAYINLGTIYFHMRRFGRAEELYRRATVADPGYVLAFFDLGNVLDELDRPDESIEAYRQAIALAPHYADAHYNLALAYEKKGEPRAAMRHWQAYVRLDRTGPWADHARAQIRKLLDREILSVAWRGQGMLWSQRTVARLSGTTALALVRANESADR
jgi:tetratricopeptide (TPR) repeat protein